MEDLIKDKLKKDLLLGDNIEVLKITPAIEEGEQTYSISVRNWDNDAIIEHTYTNSELLGFIYEQSKTVN
jgi:hypothetical protein